MTTISNNHPQKITPFLWFDKDAQEAAKFYTSVFKNSKIVNLHPMVTTFELEGMKFMALNAGPRFKFTEAISFFISCDSQEEIDYFWKNLIAGGGEESMCGWLKDKYGLSWQVVPSVLGKFMNDPNPEKPQRVMAEVLKMRKLNIQKLQEAYDA